MLADCCAGGLIVASDGVPRGFGYMVIMLLFLFCARRRPPRDFAARATDDGTHTPPRAAVAGVCCIRQMHSHARKPCMSTSPIHAHTRTARSGTHLSASAAATVLTRVRCSSRLPWLLVAAAAVAAAVADVFMGVALGAEVFMTAIEVVTSVEKKKSTVDADGKAQIYHVVRARATISCGCGCTRAAAAANDSGCGQFLPRLSQRAGWPWLAALHLRG